MSKEIKASKVEKYQIKQAKFEIKNISIEGDFYIVEGYATKFDGIDSYGDRIIKGAYTKTINDNPEGFPALYMHKADEPVGVIFELKEDDFGLFTRTRLPKDDTFVSGRLIPQMKAKSIGAMSIGFRPVKVSFIEEDNKTIKVLEEIELREISFITSNFQADSGALLTNVKRDKERSDDEILVNSMVEHKRKDNLNELQLNEIEEYYYQKGKPSPFDKEAVISTDELKSMSKSNRVFAIRELKLSANASNVLATLLETPKSDTTKSEEELLEETKAKEALIKESEEAEEKSNVSDALTELLSQLNK